MGYRHGSSLTTTANGAFTIRGAFPCFSQGISAHPTPQSRQHPSGLLHMVSTYVQAFQVPVLHPRLGPAGMHGACMDVMLSPPAPSASLQPLPCMQHHSPTPSWREVSTSTIPSILTHSTLAFFPPGIENLSPCFSNLKAWNWGVKLVMLRATEILSHKHLLCRTQSSPGL